MEEKKKVKKNNKKFIWLLIGIIAFLIIAASVGFLGGYSNSPKTVSMKEKESKIVKYLEDKYNDKFVVTNGKYIWATKNYTFDAYPKDDPNFKFPVFVTGFYKDGIGDMYGFVEKSMLTHKLLDPFINDISKDNYYSANYGPDQYMKPESARKKILGDIYKNKLTPLQAVKKYPDEIYLNATIYYAFDITEGNKIDVFKKIFKLCKFLEESKFGKIELKIFFYQARPFHKKNVTIGYYIKNDTYRNKNRIPPNLLIILNKKNIENIHTYYEIDNYIQKWNEKTKFGFGWETYNLINQKQVVK